MDDWACRYGKWYGEMSDFRELGVFRLEFKVSEGLREPELVGELRQCRGLLV